MKGSKERWVRYGDNGIVEDADWMVLKTNWKKEGSK